MTMRLIMAALLAAALPMPAMAQASDADASASDSAGPVAAVEAFMRAFTAKDEAAMAALVTDGAAMAVVQQRAEGNRARAMPMREALAGIASSPEDMAEPLDVRAVMVEGPVAMVWADYGFYLNGEQSHCGVDVFTLVRVAEGWRIATITYSHVEGACENAPRP